MKREKNSFVCEERVKSNKLLTGTNYKWGRQRLGFWVDS
jgi:hypothetical protein